MPHCYFTCRICLSHHRQWIKTRSKSQLHRESRLVLICANAYFHASITFPGQYFNHACNLFSASLYFEIMNCQYQFNATSSERKYKKLIFSLKLWSNSTFGKFLFKSAEELCKRSEMRRKCVGKDKFPDIWATLYYHWRVTVGKF